MNKKVICFDCGTKVSFWDTVRVKGYQSEQRLCEDCYERRGFTPSKKLMKVAKRDLMCWRELYGMQGKKGI